MGVHRFDQDEKDLDRQVAAENDELVQRLKSQFERLQNKALSLGFSSVVVLHTFDMLSGSTHRCCRSCGNCYGNLTALRLSSTELEVELLDGGS